MSTTQDLNGSKTTSQVIINRWYPRLERPHINYEVMRSVAKDATTSLARQAMVAMSALDEWTVDSDIEAKGKKDPDEVTYVRRFILPLRQQILNVSLFSQLDFGWKAFEMIYKQEQSEGLGIVTVPQAAKGLLNDHTWSTYVRETGEFFGLLNQDWQGPEIFIDREHSLFVNFDPEGLGKYGTPAMEIAKPIVDAWREAHEVAKRYDENVAGAFLLIHYPDGSSPFSPEPGGTPTETDHAEIADHLAQELKASGYAILPRFLRDMAESQHAGNVAPWEVQILTAGSGVQADMTTRLRYLDTLKFRAVGLTERSVSEGQMGTKAESGEHRGVSEQIGFMRHQDILDCLNSQVTDLLLTENFGADSAGKVRVAILEPENDKREMMVELLKVLMGDPEVQDTIALSIDMIPMLESLGFPIAENAADTRNMLLQRIEAADMRSEAMADSFGEQGDGDQSTDQDTDQDEEES